MTNGTLGREYSDNEVICRQGERGDNMFVIQAGRAHVFREEDEREVQVAELASGDIFGEMAIFERGRRSATVRSVGSSRVLTLDKRSFLRRVHEDPSLAFTLLQKMSHRIRSLDEQLARVKNGASAGP